jgi:hypothetical protein
MSYRFPLRAAYDTAEVTYQTDSVVVSQSYAEGCCVASYLSVRFNQEQIVSVTVHQYVL